MRFILSLCALLGSSLAFGATVEHNKEVVRRLIMLVGTPEAVEIVKKGELPEILADDIYGRVNPVGTYDGQEGTIEYFLGLGGAQGVPDIVVEPVKIPMLIGEENLVFANFIVSWLNTKENTKLTIFFDATFRMNEAGLIAAYDINARDLGQALDPQLSKVNPLLLKAGLCYQIQQACTGDNAAFKNYLDCFAFLNSIPMGSYAVAQSNSVTCRSIHLGMTAFRPEIHCPHVSRDGGGKCIDKTYESKFEFSLDKRPEEQHPHH